MARDRLVPPATGRPLAGIGRVHMWRWGSIWTSRDTRRVPPHAHHAIQVTLAPEGSIRFRHLFIEQTGVSFRAYLLWARVSRAIVRGMAGASWTDAAQATGFADSAHLSRTCRRMFGIAPSMLARE